MEGQAPEPRPVAPADPSRLRISDEDRHKVADVLRQAAGEGRIDLEELDERLEATYHAKTYGDLVPITADLPAAGTPPGTRPEAASAWHPVPSSGLPRYPSSLALMSETRRTGGWLVEDGHTAVAVMGSVVLDLRQAQFESAELTVNAHALMGEVRVVVGPGTTVVVEGTGVMGEYREQRPRVPFDPAAGGPVVRVRGFALMGSVHVQRRALPSEGPRRLRGRGRR